MYKDKGLLDIENSTHEELLCEYELCMDLWGQYSSDCFGFYISELHRKIVELGGWPRKRIKILV
jgi:hypothetical protein